MKIVMTTPILYDPKSPFNHLLKDMLEGFLEAGHSVIRIAAVESKNDVEYRLGVESSHTTYIPMRRKRAKKSNIIVRYLKDTAMNMRMARRIRSCGGDVLFEDVSYASYWSVKAAKKAGLRVVAMLQDIWPDNAVQSGLIREGSWIYRYFEAWQRAVYKKADSIVCISEDMKAFLVAKGIDEQKIEVIYNWGYSDETVRIPWEKNQFVQKFNLDPTLFYAVYAGNIGRMQNVELIVKAAEQMKEDPTVQFLIVGDGVRRDAIAELVREKELSNVTMLPMQPGEMAVHIYSAAGINIIPLVPDGVKTALPSKTGVVLSCGRPTVFCFGEDCKFSEQIRQAQCGYVTSAENADALAEVIHACQLLPTNPFCDRACDFFQKQFTQSAGVKRYQEVIKPYEGIAGK
ncbi:MAG: glycosyltransferase family 4 protein [Clostridia bacterium]|nr:glycosyltransferase family 4 protein [Clostridia bacterium]